MSELPFIWTPKRTKKLFELRFEYDWLFKSKKQPWHAFHEILRKNGFPEDMTVDHVRKKWGYTYDTYKIAKKEKRKSWKYYKMFEKHFGKAKILDKKFESWNDEWRLKLVEFVSEATSENKDVQNMWKQVEISLRTQNLPSDCCIQDVKELWNYLKSIFIRKHRLTVRRGDSSCDWPLYSALLAHYSRHERELLRCVETDTAWRARARAAPDRMKVPEEECEFQWSKDITETFIQIRMQHDWLFKEKKWVWNDLQAIMVKEYGFPKTLHSRELCRKWATLFSEYQKSVATNNTSWIYYNLFKCYLGEGSFSFNPLIGWSEEWVLNLIDARTEFEHMFIEKSRDQYTGAWREVEKRLRSTGLPLDHSLFDIPELWTHLTKTFRWKRKFADKGTLTEHWPYFDAMNKYTEFLKSMDSPIAKLSIKKLPMIQKHDHVDDGDTATDDVIDDDNFDDDMKLFDLKQKLKKPKQEKLDFVPCRACNTEEGSYNVFEACDSEGTDLASKLRVIGGIEIEKEDSLPKQICFNCLQEVENAFSFRRKCLESDREQRTKITNIPPNIVKLEIDHVRNYEVDKSDYPEFEPFDDCPSDGETFKDVKSKVKKETKRIVKRKKKKISKDRNEYKKMCEICGVHTSNLVGHLDMHAAGKAYSCDICSKKFKFKSGLQIHRAMHDPTPKKTCEVCGKTFHIVAQYKRHFVYHANERKYACETCGKRFNTPDILKVHMRMHSDERPFPCPECGKTFRTAGCVSRHRRIVHKKIAKTMKEEGIISKVSLSRKYLNTQIGITDNLSQQICFSCYKELENAFSFRQKCMESDRQQRTNLSNIIPQSSVKVEVEMSDIQFPNYEDDIPEPLDDNCPSKDAVSVNKYTQKTKKVLKRVVSHTKTKRGRKKKPYDHSGVCDICGKHAKDKYTLQVHLISHTEEKPYSCDICHKTFKYKSNVRTHMAIHIPVGPTRTCNICGMGFPSAHRLSRHWEKHANERKFPCETCGKRFNYPEVLVVHRRTHTDERPFPCSECGKTFRTGGCVSRHKRIVHKIHNNYRISQNLKM